MWDDSVSVELTGEKTRTEFRERLDYCSPRGSVEKPSRKPHNQLEERDARVASRVDAAWWTAASAAVLVIATTGTVFHWPTKATVAAAVTAAAQASLRLFFSLPFFLFPPFFFLLFLFSSPSSSSSSPSIKSPARYTVTETVGYAPTTLREWDEKLLPCRYVHFFEGSILFGEAKISSGKILDRASLFTVRGERHRGGLLIISILVKFCFVLSRSRCLGRMLLKRMINYNTYTCDNIIFVIW